MHGYFDNCISIFFIPIRYVCGMKKSMCLLGKINIINRRRNFYFKIILQTKDNKTKDNKKC